MNATEPRLGGATTPGRRRPAFQADRFATLLVVALVAVASACGPNVHNPNASANTHASRSPNENAAGDLPAFLSTDIQPSKSTGPKNSAARGTNGPAANSNVANTNHGPSNAAQTQPLRPNPPRLPGLPDGIPGGGATTPRDCAVRYLLAQAVADVDLLISCFDARTQLEFDREIRESLAEDMKTRALISFEILDCLPVEGAAVPTMTVGFRYWWPNGEVGTAHLTLVNIGDSAAPRWCINTKK